MESLKTSVLRQTAILMSRILRTSKSKVSARQRLLISLVEGLGGKVSQTDFQKLSSTQMRLKPSLASNLYLTVSVASRSPLTPTGGG
jgi:hypothetical protein